MYKPSRFFAPVLLVPGVLFEAGVRMRNLSYSKGLLTQARLPRPVVSIGNLTLGGSGKTPLVILVAQLILKLGYPSAVLTRGYGRHSRMRSHILPPGTTIEHPALELGDEPALVRRHVPAAWLGVSSDRLASGRTILGRCPDVVFLLDDGFQHRQLYRDLDIVVIDQTQPLLHNRIFPRGSLREPLSCLRRCDAVVLNGTPAAAEAALIVRAIQEINSHVPVLRCLQKIRRLVPLSAWNDPNSEDVSGVGCNKAFLVAALGNPERFRKNVEEAGIKAAGCRFFRDHHRLTPDDWRDCVLQARRCGADTLIFTEKDAIKIKEPPDFPLLVAIQSTELDRPAEMEQLLLRTIRGAR